MLLLVNHIKESLDTIANMIKNMENVYKRHSQRTEVNTLKYHQNNREAYEIEICVFPHESYFLVFREGNRSLSVNLQGDKMRFDLNDLGIISVNIKNKDTILENFHLIDKDHPEYEDLKANNQFDLVFLENVKSFLHQYDKIQ